MTSSVVYLQGALPRPREPYDRKRLGVGGTAKRLLDLAVTVAFLPLVLALALPIALFVVLDGGAPLFNHTRIGRKGKPFRCYKFRTMVAGSEAMLESLLSNDTALRQEWQQNFKLDKDPRVTLIGRILRKTSLDELPQVWNVLRGEMSWVGPRPVTEAELGKYGANLPVYLACQPGITGLWQVNGRSCTTYDERVALDVQYAREWSILLDFRILLMTIPCVLTAKGCL